MKRIFGLLIVLGLAASPALAQKVTIDYAHDFDFKTLKTFQYVDTKETDAPNQLMQDRIVAAIKRELTQGGLKEVTENPDVLVTSHLATKDDTVYTTTGFGYGGFAAGWRGWGGMGTSMTTSSTYTEGTLIIDAYLPTDKKMIWRGTGTVTLKSKPEKQTQQIDNILSKLGDRWDKILAGQGE
jgi:hypothetical protein